MHASERAGMLPGDHMGLNVCTQRPAWWLIRVNRGSGQNLLPLVCRTVSQRVLHHLRPGRLLVVLLPAARIGLRLNLKAERHA